VRVFISHSGRDRWIAQQLDRNLRDIDGVETFLDEKDIDGGDRITDRVRDEIRRCDEMLIVFSTASQQSDWVKAEIGAAWVLDKRIVVMLDKLSPRDIPQIVSDFKAVDLNNAGRYFEEVERRLRTV
jgi:hypothetical protein